MKVVRHVVLILLSALASRAAAQPIGAEFQVNSYTPGVQYMAFGRGVGMAANGDFVTVWGSQNGDGHIYGAFGQRWTSTAAKIGTEFQINTYTTNRQDFPAVAVESNGDFAVTWRSPIDGSTYGIYAQRYDSSGAKVGTEFPVNTHTIDSQRFADITSDQDGDFVIVWESELQDGSDYGAFGQRWNSSGAKLGTEFQINTVTGNEQRLPSAAVDADGDLVVVWQSAAQDGNGLGIFGQRFASDGTRSGTEFQVNAYTTFDQEFPTVAADSAGNFIVVWHSLQDSSDGIFGQQFASGGAKLGTEFQVNTYTFAEQNSAAIAMQPDGNFLVVWHSQGQDGESTGVFGQRFSAAAMKLGAEFQVNSYTPMFQQSSSVAVAPDGTAVAAWFSSPQDGGSHGIFGRLIGTPVPAVIPTSTSSPTQTPTETPTETPTSTPTETPTNTPTHSPTNTPTETPTITPTHSPTNTPTETPTITPTPTVTQTPTATGTPTPAPDGAGCGAASNCTSGICVDGVCCNELCDGASESCNVPSRLGTCTAAAVAPAVSQRGFLVALAVLACIGGLALRRRAASLR